ncbi:MAG TPA: dTMP kinase [Syntrophomonas sp.]|jgi:dTMP kinase|nr:dTMP kinase [Syntrophomonas sp.]HCF71337.1 dTMP kinase [Syntrophomonas sp.]
MTNKGRFISLEGIDGSGKTSLLESIREYLQGTGYEVLTIREPGGTLISEKIRIMLLDVKNAGILPGTEALLYAAARSQVVEEVIRPALARGQMVLADRYLDSTIAYQGYGRGLEIEYLNQLNQLCTGGLVPHLTLLLDVDPAEGARRRKKDIPDRLEKEGLEFQDRVRRGYMELSRQQPARIKVIDAGMARTDVMAQAMPYLKAVL